jgi:defect-in-organelle-trafficking protein DotC
MRFAGILLLASMIVSPVIAQAQMAADELPPPPTLSQLKTLQKQTKSVAADAGAMPIDIRRDAMKESALSYGARGGLSWRTYQIRQEMETRARYLDKVFDFRQLLIPAPSGLLIEPPIISEAQDAMIIESGGQQAAVADRIYNIGRNARIVSTARTWRAYLERQWGDVAPPPEILLPSTDEEIKIWHSYLDKGWQAGVDQADEIFQADLNKLSSDYQGMVRYRTLLAQGMVSPPLALQIDRGVTGDGNEMRVGDRAVSISGPSKLKTGTQEWQPANR